MNARRTTYLRLGNVKRHNTYIAPQAAIAAVAAMLCHNRAGGTLTCDQTAIRGPGLPFNGFTSITTHLPTPKLVG